MATTIFFTLLAVLYLKVVSSFLKKAVPLGTGDSNFGPIATELLFMVISIFFPLIIITLILGGLLDMIFRTKPNS